MNVILTYKQTEDFNEDAQELVNSLQFSVIPEMRIVDTILNEGTDTEIVYQTIPYQANIDALAYDYFKLLLESFGEVDIIGKWEDDGVLIELDINKYRDALKDIETYEKVQETAMVEDEDGVESEVVVKEYIAVKESKRPTLAQAKQTQVNVFNSKFLRQLV